MIASLQKIIAERCIVAPSNYLDPEEEQIHSKLYGDVYFDAPSGERKTRMIHTTLIKEIKELIEERRLLGPEKHREIVLASLVEEGIYTPDFCITPEYGGQRQTEEDEKP